MVWNKLWSGYHATDDMNTKEWYDNDMNGNRILFFQLNFLNKDKLPDVTVTVASLIAVKSNLAITVD